MFEKVLVANRGEIAVRVIRACRELNIRTVAVYSEADSNSMHAQLADDAICIGGAASADSYLRIDRIIGAAEISDVDAIHPGYGFLSENAHFAEVCENCNIRFIGPKSAAMNALEDKALSRELARKAGVPVPPGSEGVIETEQEALKIAKKIGYPVMIKAVAGGGGRGMRTAHNDISLVKGYHTARSEAEKSFGNSGVYIEKFIENPHHIEFQILGDSKGNIIHLGERDCSIQRRNQKLIEETPSPLLEGKHKKLRPQMGKAAIKIAQAAEYTAYLLSGEITGRSNLGHPLVPAVYGIIPTADGHIAVIGVLPHQRDDFFTVAGCPEVADDERFAMPMFDPGNRRELFAALAEWFCAAPTAEWVDRLRAVGIRCAPVNDHEQAAAYPQVTLNGYIRELDHPAGGTARVVGSPIRMSDTPPSPAAAAPELGQHTEEVLLELGYDWDRIAALREAGAI